MNDGTVRVPAIVDDGPTISDVNNEKKTRAFTSEEFSAWLLKEFIAHHSVLYRQYTDVFHDAVSAITKWRERFHGDPALWKRLFDKKSIVKEFVEACPIIDAVQRLIKEVDVEPRPGPQPQQLPPFTIVDLASGKGYLSMLLCEMLPPTKVRRFILMDKAWANHGTIPSAHHMNWDHVYDTKYKDSWPIPLVASKQDFKSGRQRRNLEQHYFDEDNNNNNENHKIILLAVHLCGTLSLKAVDFFNQNPTIHFFALKPCCLPGMIHARRHEMFRLSNVKTTTKSTNDSTPSDDQQPTTFEYCFPAQDVCLHGKWNKNTWQGPHRTSMQAYFQTWSNHLFRGIAAMDRNDCSGNSNNNDDSTRNPAIAKAIKLQKTIMVQPDGGYQNEFLLAQRFPLTPTVWDRLDAIKVPVTTTLAGLVPPRKEPKCDDNRARKEHREPSTKRQRLIPNNRQQEE